ncbi:hypothetical protein QL285_094139 [Trifolium repens]|nr:hypothetical protein QL285_094139 [Trifolium repens]
MVFVDPNSVQLSLFDFWIVILHVEQETQRMENNGGSSRSNHKSVGRHFVGGSSGQWRPALQSIEELGT